MYHLCSLFQFIQFPLYNVIITSQSYELLVSAFYLLFLVVFFISTLIYHQILPIFLSFFPSSLPFPFLPSLSFPFLPFLPLPSLHGSSRKEEEGRQGTNSCK